MYTYFSYICSGRNSLGAAEKTVTLQVYGRFDIIFLSCFWFSRHGSIESDSNKWDTDLSKLSIADDGPVTQDHEEEEIIFSNPQNNHPTLEIIEIEIPKIPEHNRKHKYSDSLSNFDEFQIKVRNLICHFSLQNIKVVLFRLRLMRKNIIGRIKENGKSLKPEHFRQAKDPLQSSLAFQLFSHLFV